MEKWANKNKTILVSIAAFFVGALVCYLVIYFLPIDAGTITNINKSEKEVTVNENGIADAVDKLYDAVVTVETYANNKLTSSGTGFVYKIEDGKGYIITNNHVIEGGTEIRLNFTDGKNVVAKVVGSDAYADIAVLTVDEANVISVADLGSSNDARVGDTVFTVGAPLDNAYSWTVTRGIISGKDRMVEVSLSNSSTSDWIMKVVQTDAAINSGNSGGPLANSNGEVIGINSLKLKATGVEGMGFAIPIEDAIEYAEQIETGKKVTRPFLGVSMIDLNSYDSLHYNGITVDESITHGVVIATVENKSPAASAGIQKGDVITELEGHAINSVAELRYYLYKNAPGDTITIKLIREKSEKTVNVKLVAND